MMKMSFNVTAKKLFGVKYERLARTVQVLRALKVQAIYRLIQQKQLRLQSEGGNQKRFLGAAYLRTPSENCPRHPVSDDGCLFRRGHVAGPFFRGQQGQGL